jgi:hypothetical protein
MRAEKRKGSVTQPRLDFGSIAARFWIEFDGSTMGNDGLKFGFGGATGAPAATSVVDLRASLNTTR